MNIEMSNLIGGLLCGAALGIGAGVSLTCREIGRQVELALPKVCVRMARLWIGRLRGEDMEEIIALFRARAALQNLAHTLARKDNGGCASAGPNVTAEKGSIDDSINY